MQFNASSYKLCDSLTIDIKLCRPEVKLLYEQFGASKRLISSIEYACIITASFFSSFYMRILLLRFFYFFTHELLLIANKHIIDKFFNILLLSCLFAYFRYNIIHKSIILLYPLLILPACLIS